MPRTGHEVVNVDNWSSLEDVQHAQLAVYVMVGGGLLGRLASEQPADFYIDSRVGRLPYRRTQIYAAVRVLTYMAVAAGLDPHHMPPMPRLHNLTVF